MADSRLTDLPNLTNPSKDDVLYIVDVTRDSSNKITYANLVTNTIDSLSAYLDGLDIPSINNIITDVASISADLPDFALQTGLNATNTNLSDLQGTVTTYGGFITKNTQDVTALSGYIDDAGSAVKVFNNETNINTISASNLTKASQSDVDLKATQAGVDGLTTRVNTNSANIISLTDNIGTINTDADALEVNVNANAANILQNEINVNALSAQKATISLVEQLSAEVMADIDDSKDPSEFTFDFNKTIASNTSFITAYHGLFPNDEKKVAVDNNGTTLVGANLSSSDGNERNWAGLLHNAYVLSGSGEFGDVDQGAIEITIFNPTASDITFTNTRIILEVTDSAQM